MKISQVERQAAAAAICPWADGGFPVQEQSSIFLSKTPFQKV